MLRNPATTTVVTLPAVSLDPASPSYVVTAVNNAYNAGLRWSLAALGRGYGSGSFGRDRLDALRAVVREGDAFWDLGAHKGFVTLAAARMVGAAGVVVAVEPASVNLRFLARHLQWNGIGNVRVVAAAVSLAFFFILSGVSAMIDAIFRVTWGHILDPAWSVNRVWCTLLGVDPPEGPGTGASLVSLALFIVLLVLVIERKLRPVEVVR